MGNGADEAMPRQRTEDLVVRAHGEETLVLDRRTDTAHCLPAAVTRIWGACTGRNTLAEIALAVGVDEPTAASAIDQLISLDLLEVRAGFDRRTFLRRGALVGAGVAAATGIQSVVAPAPSAQASALKMTLQQQCNGTNSRILTITLSQPVPSSAGYNFIVTVPTGSSGQGNISTGATTGTATFFVTNATTSITIQVRDNNGNTVVLTQTFTCLTCPTTPSGTVTACS
jgi:hypothetical protein